MKSQVSPRPRVQPKELWAEPPLEASLERLQVAVKGRPSGQEPVPAWEPDRRLSARETRLRSQARPYWISLCNRASRFRNTQLDQVAERGRPLEFDIECRPAARSSNFFIPQF